MASAIHVEAPYTIAYACHIKPHDLSFPTVFLTSSGSAVRVKISFKCTLKKQLIQLCLQTQCLLKGIIRSKSSCSPVV